jgi:hypothetical protein
MKPLAGGSIREDIHAFHNRGGAGRRVHALTLSARPQPSLTGDLKIFLDTSNPAPRATMEAMIAGSELHPDLNVESTVIDREAYKTQIRNFLTANPPDVATWYAANRMRPYVEAGLFEDVSDLWAEPAIAENLASTKGAMTIDGKQWGVPYTYYQWGVYYREGHLRRARPRRARRPGKKSSPTARRSSIRAASLLHHRHQVPVDRRRLVRLPQHAHQRLRLPHGAGRGRGQLGGRARPRDLRQLAQLIDMGALSTTTRPIAGRRRCPSWSTATPRPT